jgi:hypothetical protein
MLTLFEHLEVYTHLILTSYKYMPVTRNRSHRVNKSFTIVIIVICFCKNFTELDKDISFMHPCLKRERKLQGCHDFSLKERRSNDNRSKTE